MVFIYNESRHSTFSMPHEMYTWFIEVIFTILCGLMFIIPCTFYWVCSLALGHLHDYSGADEVTMKDVCIKSAVTIAQQNVNCVHIS